MAVSNRKNNTLNSLSYIVLLLITGYGVSYFDGKSQLFNGFAVFVWLLIFILLSISFSSVRNLIVPLINFKPLKNPITYLYMFAGILIPYLLLKLSIYHEILLDRDLIVYYKNDWLVGLSKIPLIDAVIFAPICGGTPI